MAYGLPIVTTSIGAEAIGLVNGINALIADDAEDFAHAIVRLSTDESLWQSVRHNALATIAENYSLTNADKSF
jgi:glycosyltransferase involved in cell wall biosynthesis